MKYGVEIPQPPPNNRKWQAFKAGLSRQSAIDLMNSMRCARTVRSDGLWMAGKHPSHRWVMTSYCGEPT